MLAEQATDRSQGKLFAEVLLHNPSVTQASRLPLLSPYCLAWNQDAAHAGADWLQQGCLSANGIASFLGNGALTALEKLLNYKYPTCLPHIL